MTPAHKSSGVGWASKAIREPPPGEQKKKNKEKDDDSDTPMRAGADNSVYYSVNILKLFRNAANGAKMTLELSEVGWHKRIIPVMHRKLRSGRTSQLATI